MIQAEKGRQTPGREGLQGSQRSGLQTSGPAVSVRRAQEALRRPLTGTAGRAAPGRTLPWEPAQLCPLDHRLPSPPLSLRALPPTPASWMDQPTPPFSPPASTKARSLLGPLFSASASCRFSECQAVPGQAPPSSYTHTQTHTC